MKGIERRIEAGLDPDVRSVASLFISRWDVAVHDEVPEEMQNTLGDRGREGELQGLPRAARFRADAEARGGRRPRAAAAVRVHRDQGPRRLGHALRRGVRGAGHDQHDARQDPARLRRPRRGRRAAARGRRRRERGASRRTRTPGIDIDALAERLQVEGAEAFSKSWHDMLDSIAEEAKKVAS